MTQQKKFKPDTIMVPAPSTSILPERELKRIKPEFIAKYLPKKQQ